MKRRLQFSLRTLLVAVGLCAVFLGVRYSDGEREKAAIVKLRDAGGDVSYLTYDNGVTRATNELPKGNGFLRRCLEFVWPLSYTISIWVTTADMNDALWYEMTRIRHLSELEVQGAEITDAGKRAVSRLTNLKRLSLEMELLSDEDCQVLAQLQDLQSLHLWGKVKFECCNATLTNLQNLEELWIDKAWLDDADLVQLGELKTLRSLRVSVIGGGATLDGVNDLKRSLPQCEVVIQVAEP